MTRWVPTVIEQPDVPADCIGVLQVSAFMSAGLASATLYVRPGLDDGQGQRLMTWVAERLERLQQHGGEPDGWGTHIVDGEPVLQLYAVEQELPDL